MGRLASRLILAVGLIFTGCFVRSLHPLYTDEDIVFEPALVGVWAEEDAAKETWTFERNGEKGYRLVYTEGWEQIGEFEVHLLKLDGTLFLDLYPDVEGLDEANLNDPYQLHLLAAHSFAKVTRIEPMLEVQFMDPEWLEEFLRNHPRAIQHATSEIMTVEGPEPMSVLTASTKGLQQFILEHVNEAFVSGPSRQGYGLEHYFLLKRIKPEP